MGILAYGSYVPYWRLSRSTIRAATGVGRGSGTRAVAGYDEDSTTLAVEAARDALRTSPIPAQECGGLVLATSSPVYADKTNATALHAALGLPQDAHVADAAGAVRSGIAALLSAMYRPSATLVALSDLRSGPSGSSDEARGGDGAAAFVVGDAGGGELVAELIGVGSASREFLDRWKAPGEPWSATWEERFGEDLYRELGVASVDHALKQAGISVTDVDHLAVTGLSDRAAGRLGRDVGVDRAKVADDLVDRIGNCGAAHPGLLLAAVLDAVGPDQVVAVTVLADGADTLLFRTSPVHRPRVRGVEEQIRGGTGEVSYVDFLTWRGLVERQQPRRPDPDRAVAPATNRQLDWKFGFTCSACLSCGTRHLPPQQVCLRCGTVDSMAPTRLADTPATIATYTVDHLAFSLAPPVVGAVVDFDGGGRFMCELTDLAVDGLAVGQRVGMSFRRVSTTGGIHNYFWKATPLNEERPA
ncbi:hydroxymethylglutaryl-CoA synthase family protein [Pseudonocardia ailaonensis]|uniref:Hydroxymethylglutaryl-CoA synthase family protein n=1 Tax=Pseudonocardia ailaonensis TaxID=367279 RepID=A0ABN2NEG7_9PSEU